MKHSRIVIAVSFVLSQNIMLLVSCSTEIKRTPGNGGTTSGADGLGGFGGNSAGWGGDGATLVIEDASSGGYYDGPKYDGDQSCTPLTIPQAESSCCNGLPCQGNCEFHDGSWGCFCYGVKDGCAQYNMVCCYTRSGCTTEESCNAGL